MTEKKETSRKGCASGKALKKVMADHFYELDEAVKTGSRKIAWCTSVGPAELLRGMGFLVYKSLKHVYPEISLDEALKISTIDLVTQLSDLFGGKATAKNPPAAVEKTPSE